MSAAQKESDTSDFWSLEEARLSGLSPDGKRKARALMDALGDEFAQLGVNNIEEFAHVIASANDMDAVVRATDMLSRLNGVLDADSSPSARWDTGLILEQTIQMTARAESVRAGHGSTVFCLTENKMQQWDVEGGHFVRTETLEKPELFGVAPDGSAVVGYVEKGVYHVGTWGLPQDRHIPWEIRPDQKKIVSGGDLYVFTPPFSSFSDATVERIDLDSMRKKRYSVPKGNAVLNLMGATGDGRCVFEKTGPADRSYMVMDPATGVESASVVPDEILRFGALLTDDAMLFCSQTPSRSPLVIWNPQDNSLNPSNAQASDMTLVTRLVEHPQFARYLAAVVIFQKTVFLTVFDRIANGFIHNFALGAWHPDTPPLCNDMTVLSDGRIVVSWGKELIIFGGREEGKV